MRFMKPIPTTYGGVQFRSRLEARWAVFFDRLQVHWTYEPFEISNNNLSYVPDFELYNLFLCFYNHKALVEIKPLEPNAEYIEYLKNVKGIDGADIFVFYGEPNFGIKNAIRVFSSGPDKNRITLSEKGLIEVCPKCRWFKWVNANRDRSETNCECKIFFYKPESDIKRAYIETSQHRFDLNMEEDV